MDDVVMVRPFVPASDFQASFRFYEELGFSGTHLAEGLAAMQAGPFSFLLQAFEAPGFAGHFMMQLKLRDQAAWWARISALDLASRYAVRAPMAPAMQPWGLVVAYVFDPAGVLWHVIQA